MVRLRTWLLLALLTALVGCNSDTSKGVNKGLDQPKAPLKTDTPPPAKK